MSLVHKSACGLPWGLRLSTSFSLFRFPRWEKYTVSGLLKQNGTRRNHLQEADLPGAVSTATHPREVSETRARIPEPPPPFDFIQGKDRISCNIYRGDGVFLACEGGTETYPGLFFHADAHPLTFSAKIVHLRHSSPLHSHRSALQRPGREKTHSNCCHTVARCVSLQSYTCTTVSKTVVYNGKRGMSSARVSFCFRFTCRAAA